MLPDTKKDDRLELTLNDGKKIIVQRIGTSNNEPTFKFVEDNKPVRRASTLFLDVIKEAIILQ